MFARRSLSGELNIYARSTAGTPGPKPGGLLGGIFVDSKRLKINGRGERI
jgi:hypothetical protein